MFKIVDLIRKKRDGEILTEEEIKYFVECVASEKIEQCQLGAMLMAIFLKGMSTKETVTLTLSMMQSGSSFDWPIEWADDIVDKHSTGGVGDKVSLILTPTLAACGLKVPMITGRGLGFSGGTLDKLEAIPGFTVSCSREWVQKCIKTVGCCIAGQTKDIVPADRIMYACRGITSTVDCIPLIVGSIISKKAIEKPSALVLDIKVGSAAFMTSFENAKTLAESLVSVAQKLGISTTAIISKMDWPLGHYIGNALEVAESINGLNAQMDEDLKELVTALGAHLMMMTGKVNDFQSGKDMVWSHIKDGSALNKFKEMIKCQGVKEELAEKLCTPGADVWTVLPKAKMATVICYEGEDGYIKEINARILAEVCLLLGTGRLNQHDSISYSSGLQLLQHVGSPITCGDAWITIHHDKPISPLVEVKVKTALIVGNEPLPGDHLNRIIATVQ